MYEHEDCQHCRTVGHFVLYYMPGFEQHQLWTFLFSSAAPNKVFRHRFGSSDATVWPRPDVEDPTWRQNLFKIQTAHLPEAHWYWYRRCKGLSNASSPRGISFPARMRRLLGSHDLDGLVGKWQNVVDVVLFFWECCQTRLYFKVYTVYLVQHMVEESRDVEAATTTTSSSSIEILQTWQICNPRCGTRWGKELLSEGPNLGLVRRLSPVHSE